MKNYRKLPHRDCCFYCNSYDWNMNFDMYKCNYPGVSPNVEIEPDGICDNFDDEIRGN